MTLRKEIVLLESSNGSGRTEGAKTWSPITTSGKCPCSSTSVKRPVTNSATGAPMSCCEVRDRAAQAARFAYVRIPSGSTAMSGSGELSMRLRTVCSALATRRTNSCDWIKTANASEELLRRVGLGEIVVSACSEPLDDLRRLVVRRQEEHLHLVAKPARGRTKVTTDVDAGNTRHYPVEHQYVRALLLRDALENVGAIAEYFHSVVVAKRLSGALGVEGAVVHDPHLAWWAIQHSQALLIMTMRSGRSMGLVVN